MKRMISIGIWILVAALLLAGTGSVFAQAPFVQSLCAPGDSNGARPYWSYYQFPSVAICDSPAAAQPQPYWSYYQFPPRTDFAVANRP